MAKGEGAEQYSNASLLNKSDSSDSVKLARKSEHRHRLTICNKICYAIGGAPYQITGCALGFFLQLYLLDVAQLDPFYASIILFFGRAWDAVTDPTVGFLVSRSPWTRFGRMMPWIVLSTPLAVMSYFLIWYVPPFEDGKVVWYIFFYCIFQSLQTCFHVPYSALTMFITSEQKERDSATAYRMTVEVLGTVVGTAIQGQIVGMTHAPCLPGPMEILADPTNNYTLIPHNVSEHSISLQYTRNAYMIASAVICSIYILCAVVLCLGVREHETIGIRSKPMPFFQGIKMVMGYGPYAKLVMGFLFTSLAFMLLEGNFALFCSYTLGFRKDFQNILLVIMLSATLAIPVWQWFLTRFGKKMAAYVGSLSAVPFMILVVCIKSNLIVTYVVAFASGVAVAAAFLLPWSMLPDVVDDFQVRNPESTGHEAIFYSFYVFFTKFASGISLGVSTLSLDFAGYISRGCSQPEEVDLTLKLLVSAAPIVLIFIGLGILYTYPIDEERRQGNRKYLQDLRDEEDSETDSREMADMI
ncbi:sodium-dependent lysophosphatidylcholine symporter 1-B [Cyprinodon tularosa]|uniref:MFSD2 lysolipid transporter A, lysophospholipid b n=1 Tax=Cyprinodon variegatus TaxID=28743 RepID=A0A3Q2D6P3_CYPVA|nr:PREDICTED: sodium-dependent lysophosphatidylcholine symporter 1 [Cyprinodon variegatus]XP_038164984.1 sodium-dependent lysophosphatidylcholine symporter 1-B [Cyprinodon tularosa]